jgi:LPS export ABC transporter protein LptC
MNQRRLAQRILVVVALFVLTVAGMLVARSRSTQPETAQAPQPAAELEMKGIRLEEETRGRRWRLTADQASVFEEQGRTLLRNVNVRVDDRGRVWTIVGREGELVTATRDFEIRDGVVVASDDGIRLETSVLRWRNAEQRLWTDAPVRIVRDQAIVEGQGLEVRMEDDVTTVQGRLRATFHAGISR